MDFFFFIFFYPVYKGGRKGVGNVQGIRVGGMGGGGGDFKKILSFVETDGYFFSFFPLSLYFLFLFFFCALVFRSFLKARAEEEVNLHV